jgi:Ni/Co efflux regulator RcnB
MKRFQTIILITAILVAACAFNAVAQKRADKTSSAKAAYGHVPQKQKMKKKKKVKGDGAKHKKPAKGTRADAWSVRRKFTRL